MSLAEIREVEASAEVAATYAALRAASGVPQVNLIWRHAAALPGVLDWLWLQARPALDSGAAAGARDRIADAVALPAIARSAAPPEAVALVETYNRGNITNLALLTAVRLRTEGMGPGAPAAPAPIGAPLPEPPPLPCIGTLSPAATATVQDLAARHALSDATVIPSLYLHLTLWPDLLAALPALLPDAGTLRAGRDAAVAAAKAEAPGLIAVLGPAPAAPPGLGEFLATLRLFTREVIPGMIPVGLGLRRAFAGTI
ncbi:hypothetical protein KPL78_08135 [Roseomonas sp. HJA6]|uniref:Uncharacterized protein n=1 Tax=Roseomonas alba TaxID=2846776 RepID=A0ABS7A6I4_9PROT|nr:hypothetical protein [Neoroseomonas alba]MBW6397808.1 hypothetical protein [Neoroseomonas alba]